ncbi:hypothetical protein [Nocardioides nitrophenolicus]|uniref:hypothetical protein n=1 Tax=Nocardioides nitrophenolicus TaxID=60489 RepID=UPI00195CA216|nr:hypothetical protein [Nocardioides nitrophenolicus]MBM7520312.1 hypothetical protein [Nocardioides nitrophenolicus]
MADPTRSSEPSAEEGALVLPPNGAVEEVAGWDQGLAYVETVLARLVADRTEAADLIRARARVTAVDEAQARALAHVVGEAVRAALRADTDRAAARLELAERVRAVLPLRAAAVEVLAGLDAALAALRAGERDLTRILDEERIR